MNKENKGNYGWLDLQRMSLPFTTMRRFDAARRREPVTAETNHPGSATDSERVKSEERRDSIKPDVKAA